MFKTFVGSAPEYLAGCESVIYRWEGDWKRLETSDTATVEPPDAVEFRMPIIPPPDSPGIGTVIVTAEGATSYAGSESIPSLPACVGVAPRG